MNKNPLKSALARNRQTYGCWISLAHPLIPEILAAAGFDWLAVDMEHSSIGLSELLPLIISIEANGIVPLVRVGENNPNLIKRVMDLGSYGVIVPNVCTEDDAKSAVNAVRYPPFGRRGVGLYRAQKFGRGFESYKKWLAKESVVIIQIEHIDAVRNIEAIFSTLGIDAFIVGPYDLSASVGKPGAFDDPKVINALKEIMNAAHRYKIVPGFHSVSADPRDAIMRRKQGFKFLGFSIDAILLGDKACDALAKVKNLKQ